MSDFEKEIIIEPFDEESVFIHIRGKRTLVDKDDINKLNGYYLRAKRTDNNDKYYIECYTQREKGNRKQIALHRLITNCNDGEVDHINGDTLDNRKCNLRIVDHFMNCRNKKVLTKTKFPRFITKSRNGHFTVSIRKRDGNKRKIYLNKVFRSLNDAVQFRDNWIIDNDWFGLEDHYIKQFLRDSSVVKELEAALESMDHGHWDDDCMVPPSYEKCNGCKVRSALAALKKARGGG